MKKINLKLFVITLLSISFLNTGCYSYFAISSDELSNKETENKIKIILKDKKEVITENSKVIITSDLDEIIILQTNSTRVTYSLDEVEKILEEKFDFGKTFFSVFWLSILTLVIATGILVLLFGPITFA
ncbi:MAG: hypothetical protein ABFS12_03760 [Bacteroidota bacterium]